MRKLEFSVQFSCSLVLDSLQPHGLQHTRLPCPSPTPGAYSNSCPLSQWCHPNVLSSVIPFSSHIQSFPGSGSFPMSKFFASSGQSIGVSASASVLPEYSGLISFRRDWLDLLAVQGTLKSRPQHHSSKASILWHTGFFIVQLSHPYKTTGKTKALTRQTLVGKVMPLLFNMLSRLVIAFLPRSKRLLISWLQSSSTVILEPPKIKSLIVFIVSPSICNEVMVSDAMILVFWMLTFKPTFSLSSFTLIKRFFGSSLFSAIRVVSSAYLRLLIFLSAILNPACASSNLAFRMMYSAYKLNKQGDNTQPWCTPFPTWNQSVVPCTVLTVASWPGDRLLKIAQIISRVLRMWPCIILAQSPMFTGSSTPPHPSLYRPTEDTNCLASTLQIVFYVPKANYPENAICKLIWKLTPRIQIPFILELSIWVWLALPVLTHF